MMLRRLHHLLLWLACASYVAQAAMGAGQVLCMGPPGHEPEHSTHETGACSHSSPESSLPIVPVHSDEDPCSCNDIELGSDPGRVDAPTVIIPPLTEVGLVALPALSVGLDADHRPVRAAASIGLASPRPDIPRLRCVILLI